MVSPMWRNTDKLYNKFVPILNELCYSAGKKNNSDEWRIIFW